MQKALCFLSVLIVCVAVTACDNDVSNSKSSLVEEQKFTVQDQKGTGEDQIAAQTSEQQSLCLADTWWRNYKNSMISADGRVIDYSDPRAITTSEGQSYALFFALVMNDSETFSKLLGWTENNLAEGDLSENLPAWLWGKRQQDWGIIDTNSASDSDLIVAYSLMEAGRIWNKPNYRALGELLAQNMVAKESLDTKAFGTILLPGAYGFVHDNGNKVKINPSYYPLMMTAYLAQNVQSSAWDQIHQSSLKLIKTSAKHGFSPDWWTFEDKAYSQEVKTQSQLGNTDFVSSYDAIRTYMWSGMTTDTEMKQTLIDDVLYGMSRFLVKNKSLPEKFDLAANKHTGDANISFYAATLPYLDAIDPQLARKQALKIIATYDHIDSKAYYTQSLIGFGLGWWQGWFRFDQENQLRLHQTGCTSR